jgi:tetratricopeptide (TPR) repeat protein
MAWQYRAQLFIKIGDYDRAIEDYTTTIQLANEINWLCQCLYAHRAEVYHLNRQYNLAIADYEKSLSYGEYLKSRLGLAEVYIDLHRPEKAMEQLQAAEAIPGAGGSDYLTIGAIYESMGAAEAAGSAYLRWINAMQYERMDEKITSVRSGSMELDMTQGRAYYVPVTVPSGKTLTVNATARGASVDPLIVILDSDGNPVAGSDDVSDTDHNARIDRYQAEPGLYTIVVTHAGGGSSGIIDLDWSKHR